MLSSSPSLSSSTLSCEQCGETFYRREHRDRHLLRHTGARPFPCHICSKSFSRNDTLNRHLALHQRTSIRSLRNPRADTSTAVGRRRVHACLPCAGRKQRCEGGVPCPQCLVRGLDCSYAPPRASTTRDAELPSPLSSGGNVETAVYDSLSDVTPLVQLEPLAFDGFLPQDGAFAGAINSHSIAYDDLAMEFAFPWTMPWAMEGLEHPTENHGLLVPLDVSNASATRDQTYLSPQFICSRYATPCPPFPDPQILSLEMAEAEIYGHVFHISERGSEGLHAFYQTQQQEPDLSPPIPSRILHAFIELYFEHFDPQFPFLHTSRLDCFDVPWVLLLATAAVGSHYSVIPQAHEYHLVLCELLDRGAESLLAAQAIQTDVVVVQVVFLLHVLWMFSGSHRDKIVQRQKRSVLATLCRDLLSKTDSQESPHVAQIQPIRHEESQWRTWLVAEERVRLVSCIRCKT